MALSGILLSLLALTGSALGDLEPIVAKGSKLFYKNGTQFFIKGVAYQQEVGTAGAESSRAMVYIDPLANVTNCQRDVPLLKELGTNTIRTYAIDPKADHSACMKLLDEAGIYVISDLSEPSLSINRKSPDWTLKLFTRYQKVIDEMSKYQKVIGFLAGNEVTNNENNTEASAYVKAAVRDSKKYIKDSKTINRWIGVGYATNDHRDIRLELAQYFACEATDASVDFWGYNVYSWCGDSSLLKAEWEKQVEFFKDYPVPVFFAEYGCNKVSGGGAKRFFTETTALYSNDMTGVFSGGLVFKYFQETNDFGLIELKGSNVSRLDAFDNLKKHATKAEPEGVSMSEYQPSSRLRECPAVTNIWRTHKALPPTPDRSLCECMVKSLSCVPNQGLSLEKYGDLFSLICGSDPKLCAGIDGNPTEGVYGAYSMCDSGAKLAYVMNAYYEKEKRADACNFGGQAFAQKDSSGASCSAALASASEANKHAAVATTPLDSKKSKSTDQSSAVHGIAAPRILSLGGVALSVYVLAALGTGVIAIAF